MTQQSEMARRVAKAFEGVLRGGNWTADELAEVALKEVREPTAQMKETGSLYGSGFNGDDLSEELVDQIWRVMAVQMLAPQPLNWAEAFTITGPGSRSQG